MKGIPHHRLLLWKSGRHISIAAFLIFLIALILFAIAYAAHLDLAQLFTGMGVSFVRVVVAYLISLALAILIALFITRKSSLEDFTLPILDVLQSFPSFALLPFIVKIFGHGGFPVVLILIINIIWPILFALISGIKSLRDDLGEAAMVFGAASGWKRIWNFTLPGIFPSIITGSIIGWGEGWEAIAGAEIIAGSSGIGRYITEVTNAGATQLLVLTLVFMLFIVFIVNNWFWLRLLKKVSKWGE
jgi:ABC-type nitrate/sulfonate/bicarbonate transport system permease component